MATPDGYAGHKGSPYPPQGPAWHWGKPPTRHPVSPVPVPSASTIAGLERDSRGWSVACALKPHNPN